MQAVVAVEWGPTCGGPGQVGGGGRASRHRRQCDHEKRLELPPSCHLLNARLRHDSLSAWSASVNWMRASRRLRRVARGRVACGFAPSATDTTHPQSHGNGRLGVLARRLVCLLRRHLRGGRPLDSEGDGGGGLLPCGKGAHHPLADPSHRKTAPPCVSSTSAAARIDWDQERWQRTPVPDAACAAAICLPGAGAHKENMCCICTTSDTS